MSSEENESPYLSARFQHDSQVTAANENARFWRRMAGFQMFGMLMCVAGVVWFSGQSHFIPYVVKVNDLGQLEAVDVADKALPADPRVIRSSIATFVTSVRMVTVDGTVQRAAVQKVFDFVQPGSPAMTKLNEFYRTDALNPGKRAVTETVEVEIVSVLPISEKTWRIEWSETVRTRQGALKSPPFHMTATVSIFLKTPTVSTTEKELRSNPLGIFVDDFSVARQS
jgi:type IV secretion system protein TrbF